MLVEARKLFEYKSSSGATCLPPDLAVHFCTRVLCTQNSSSKRVNANDLSSIQDLAFCCTAEGVGIGIGGHEV